MKVFVYEHISGGGTWGDDSMQRPSGGLLSEGRAMVQALVTDFAAVSGVDVVALRDSRLTDLSLERCSAAPVNSAAEHRRAFERWAGRCDATVLVAPEISGTLLDCCQRALAAGATLISPGTSAVESASNKLALARRLSENGIPSPVTEPVSPHRPLPGDFSYPAVLKPACGAGSSGVRLIHSSSAWDWTDSGSSVLQRTMAFQGRRSVHISTALEGHRTKNTGVCPQIVENPDDSCAATDWLLQEFCPGTPVSVAFVCRRSGRHAMIPCRQRVTDDGRFRYLGGDLPLPTRLAQRAIRLADAAVACALPGVVGYVGVDLVLGDAPDGGDDRVIEINPRLTTSYVGLRVAARTNLAAAMLAAAEDRRPDMRFSTQSLQFDADGTVRGGVVA